MRNTQREVETQAEGEAGSMLGAQRGTRLRVSRIMPWAKGSAKLLSHPGCQILIFLNYYYLSSRLYTQHGAQGRACFSTWRLEYPRSPWVVFHV